MSAPEETPDADVPPVEEETPAEDDTDVATDAEVPPIVMGDVPATEGDSEGAGNADDEYGIAPMYFHEHEHQYEPYGDPYSVTDYEYEDMSYHYRVRSTYQLFICEGCSDQKIEEAGVYSKLEPHFDADGDGECDGCEGTNCYFEGKQEDPNFAQETCTHPNAQWNEPEIEPEYDDIPAGYDVNTDVWYPSSDSEQYLPKSTGHTKMVVWYYEGYLPGLPAQCRKI